MLSKEFPQDASPRFEPAPTLGQAGALPSELLEHLKIGLVWALYDPLEMMRMADFCFQNKAVIL